MAERISLTTLVDVSLETGAVDASKLNAQMEKYFQQALAKLPGLSAALSPDIKVNPKFNIEKVSGQLKSLLSDPKITQLEGKAGFDKLTASVTKYTRALDHLTKMQGGLSEIPGLDRLLLQLQKGEVAFEKLPVKTQGRLREFSKQWAEFQKVIKQVANEFTKIGDLAFSPAQEQQIRKIEGRIKELNQVIRSANAIINKPQPGQDIKGAYLARKDATSERTDLRSLRSEIQKQSLGAFVSPQIQDVLRQTEFLANLEGVSKKQQAALKKQADEARQLRQQEIARAEVEAYKEEAARNKRIADVRKAEFAAYREDAARRKAIQQEIARAEAEAYKEEAARNRQRESVRKAEFAAYREDAARKKALQQEIARAEVEAYKEEAARNKVLAGAGAPSDKGKGVLASLGGVVGNFARYAIGYGALYKLTQGVQELIRAAIDLEDKLKTIQAISGSTNTEMTGLGETIKGIAKSSAFDFNDIADAVKTLVQAGVPLKQIPATAQAVVNVATASGESLQVAADVLTTAQEIWDNVDITTIGDRITQAANVSKLAVTDLQTILNLEGSAAAKANLTLEQNLALIATARNSGLKPSTIATGLTELFAELLSPDKKLKEFLAKRYQAIGETRTPEEAGRRFAEFRYADNPVLAALTELKRVGADTAAAAVDLERAVDRRALRPLTAFMRDLGEILKGEANLVTAPSSQQAAQVALDSLKKATANLEDAMKALSSTIMSGGLLEALTSMTRSATSFVNKAEEWVVRSQQNNEVLSGFGTAALFGAGSAFLASRGGSGLLSKALRGITGGVSGAAAAYAGENLAKDAGVPQGAVDAAIGTAGAVAATSLLGKLGEWLKGVASKVKLSFPSSAAGEVTAGTNAVKAAAQTGLRGYLAGLGAAIAGAFAANPVTWLTVAVGAFIYAFKDEAIQYFKALRIQAKSLFDLDPKSFSASLQEAKEGPAFTSGGSISPLIEKKSREDQQNQQANADFAEYYSPQPGEPPKSSGPFFLLQDTRDKLTNVREKLANELGTQLSEDQDQMILELTAAYEKRGLESEGARKEMLSRLKAELGGTKNPSDAFATELLQDAIRLNQQVSRLGDVIKAKHQELFSAEQEPGTAGAEFRAAFETLKSNNKQVSGLLHGQALSITDTLAVFDGYATAMAAVADKHRASVADAASNVSDLIRQTLASQDSNTFDLNMVDLTKAMTNLVSERGLSVISAIQEQFETAIRQSGEDGALADPKYRAQAAKVEKAYKRTLGDSVAARLEQDAKDLAYAYDQIASPKLGADAESIAAIKDLQEFTTAAATKARQGLDTSLLEDLKSYDRDINQYISEKSLQRTQEGRLSLGATYLDAIRRQQAGELDSPKYQEFVSSDRSRDLDNKIAEAEDRIEKLRSFADAKEQGENLNRLANTDLLKDLHNLRQRRIEVELQHETQQRELSPPVDEQEKAKLDERINTLNRQYEKEYTDYLVELKKAQDDYTKFLTQRKANEAKLALSELNTRVSSAQKERSLIEDTGDLSKVLAINERIKGLKEEQLAAEKKVLELTNKDGDATDQILLLKEKQAEALLDLQGVDSLLKAEQANFQIAQDTPAGGRNFAAYFARAKALASGQSLSIADQIAQASNIQRALQQNVSTNDTEIERRVKRLAFLQANEPGNADAIDEVSGALAKLRLANLQYAEDLGKIQQLLEDINATPKSEFDQISATSIAAKINELPGAMRNLNTNIEGRFIQAADGVSNVMAQGVESLVAGLLGLSDVVNQTANELNALRDAQANYADIVATGSLDIADQISSIKQNEVDPARQEYLIQRALDAQKQAEGLAKAQVDEANRQYQFAQDQTSVFGQLRQVGADFFGGIAADLAKASVLDVFKNLFGLGGKRGDSITNPVYTQDVNGGAGGILGDAGKAGGGGILGSLSKAASGIGDWFGSAWKSISGGVGDLFGGSGSGNVFTKIGDWAGSAWNSLSGGAGNTLTKIGDWAGNAWKSLTGSGSAIGGAASGASSAAGSAGAVGGIVGGLASIAGTLFNYFDSQDQVAPTYTQGESALTGSDTGVYYAKAGLTKDTLAAWRSNLTAPMKSSRAKSTGLTRSAASGVSALAAMAAPVQQETTVNVRSVLVDDHRRVADFINSPAGDRVIVGALKRNQNGVKQALQG